MQVSADKFLASECRKSYYQFFLQFWGQVAEEKLRLNWHVEKLCHEMQVISERVFADQPKEYDLLANCPPGSTKSKIVSVLWQPWIWTRMPSARFLSGSYSERIALDLARQSRDLVLSEKYHALFPDIELRADQNTKGYFMNNRGGWRFATGVGGTATGMHAHFIAVDDPLDPIGALSDLVLYEADVWIKETLADRKVEKWLTPTVMIMQRLHQNDPTGAWLRRGGKIRHIVIPAELGWPVLPPEWSRYYKDGLFDPVRFPHEVLAEARKRGDVYYAGQYGNSPIPRGGAMFHVAQLRFRTDIPTKWKRGPIRFWDKASSHNTGAWTAGVKGGIDMDNQVWILDVRRGQWDSGTREKMIVETGRMDGRRVRIGIEQEPSGAGKEAAVNTVARLALKDLRAYANTVRGDKETRAEDFSVQVNLGNVILVTGPWNHEYVEEMRYFPLSLYKDQIDASSGLYTGLAKQRIRIGAF
jgi:predicted phage terminase large subunit-like protein